MLDQPDSTLAQPDLDFSDSGSSKSERAVALADHSQSVADRAGKIAIALGLDDWHDKLVTAGLLHDLGKADPRFQSMLLGNSAAESWLIRNLLAKSSRLATSSRARQRDQQRSQLPPRFRHELLSSQLAQRLLPDLDPLTQHLIEAHHGYARPWFPAWLDDAPTDVDLQPLGIDCQLTADQRHDAAETGVRLQAAERFWTLQNRYGVWQTALLESILRLADQQVSREESSGVSRVVSPACAFPQAPVEGTSGTPTEANGTGWRAELAGLDGSNPLAFLAAIGLLRLLHEATPEAAIKMHWEVIGGVWAAVLTTASPLAHDGWFDEQLSQIADRELASVLSLIDEDKGKIISSPQQYGAVAQRTLQSFLSGNASRSDCDFLTALGSEMSRRVEQKKETDAIEYSELYMTRGSGHQRMLELAHNIRQATNHQHLAKASLSPWCYDDPGKSMNLRWDPLDDRQYAKRWLNPSNDPSQTVWGANDLAFEALPLFPTGIVNGRLQTAAFHRVPKQGTFFTWPIWVSPLSLPVVRSLLQCSQWQRDAVDGVALSALAIDHLRRVQRVRNDKFFNFSMSTTVADRF